MNDDRSFDEALPDEAFLSRWSRRKQASKLPVEARADATGEAEERDEPALTDDDMPSLETLDENSDYGGFFSPKVSEALRQQALQKLFLSQAFNVCDGLDDYAEDFTQFEKLGDVITAELRHRLEQEAKRAAEKAEAAKPAQEQDTVEAGRHAPEPETAEGHAVDRAARDQEPSPETAINKEEDNSAS